MDLARPGLFVKTTYHVVLKVAERQAIYNRVYMIVLNTVYRYYIVSHNNDAPDPSNQCCYVKPTQPERL